MQLAFAGTPEFAAIALRALICAGHTISLVLTQPDRAAGRGLKTRPSEVKTVALEHGLDLSQPDRLRSDEVFTRLQAANARALIVAAYGLILPQRVLDAFPLGCINIHASLLPRWRGAAPIQRAILAGDAETGISIMHMDAGLDTGPVYMKEAIAIAADDTGVTLHDKLAHLGARCIVSCLEAIERDNVQPVPQPSAGATYAHKIEKREASIDWTQSAIQIERQVRAFNPFPVATSTLRGELIRIWSAQVSERDAAPAGQILAVNPHYIEVACGERSLSISELQRPGGKRISVAAFLQGTPVRPGETLGM
jgi:methionyl-tRNA formyltransferase